MAKLGKPRTAKGLAVLCAKIAEDKIAGDILIMDLSKIDSAPTDFFVICSCDSDVQIRALVKEIDNTARVMGLKPPRVEGLENCQWVLADFFDVIVHVMLPQARDFYKLERLWGDARFYQLDEDGKPKTIKL